MKVPVAASRSYQTRLLPVDMPPAEGAAGPPRVSTSAQNGVISGFAELPVMAVGVKELMVLAKLTDPLLFTHNPVNTCPKKFSPPGSTGARSMKVEEPSSVRGSAFSPKPAMPPSPLISVVAIGAPRRTPPCLEGSLPPH